MAGDPNQVAALLASITASLQQNQQHFPQAPYPAPTSSGTLDLSSLIPTNSGTVSLPQPGYEDWYRSDNGFGVNNSSNGGYPRHRDYDDHRERDRYPANGQNRYDESYSDRDRRGSREQGNHGRDRSFSPNRRQQAPQVDPNDKVTDPMIIDQGYVGLVIGKGGDTLRKVENSSGARVQFMNESHSKPGERLCNLIGTRRQTDHARRLIDDIIAENIAIKGPLPSAKVQHHPTPAHPPKPPTYDNTRLLQEGGPESVLQIMVPDKTVGLIIGRQGENIKDLQAKSGARINIVPENQSIAGQRPINLIGDMNQTNRARELIMQIVADDEAGIPISRKPPPEALGANSRQEIIKVPQDAVGMIIGKGGETVREMQSTSQCSIKVSSSFDSDLRDITLTGTFETIQRAKRLIEEKVSQLIVKRMMGSVV